MLDIILYNNCSIFTFVKMYHVAVYFFPCWCLLPDSELLKEKDYILFIFWHPDSELLPKKNRLSREGGRAWTRQWLWDLTRESTLRRARLSPSLGAIVSSGPLPMCIMQSTGVALIVWAADQVGEKVTLDLKRVNRILLFPSNNKPGGWGFILPTLKRRITW